MSGIRIAILIGCSMLIALVGTAEADDRELLKPLIDKALTTSGEGRMQDIRAWNFTERTTTGDQVMEARWYIQPPHRYRHELKSEPDGEPSVTVIRGEKGWATESGKTTPMAAEEVEAHWDHFWLYGPFLGPQILSNTDYTLTRLGETVIEGATTIGIQLTRDDTSFMRVHLERATGLLIKVEKPYETPEGQKGVTEILLSDYREVDGLMLPHRKRVGEADSVYFDWKIIAFRFAERLDEQLFERPGPEVPPFVDEFLVAKRTVDEQLKKLMAAAKEEGGAAQTADERRAIFSRYAREANGVKDRLIETVMSSGRPHVAHPALVEPLAWVVNNSYGSDRGNKAAELLMKHHLTRPETLELARRHRRAPQQWTGPMLRAQLATAELPDAERPRTLHALAVARQSESELSWKASNLTLVPAEREYYGRSGVTRLQQIDSEKAESEAIELFSDVAERYGSIELVEGITFAELAENAIFEIQNLSVGKTAPEIIGEDIDGVRFRLSDYRGRVVVLSFWGTWCGPCMDMVPHERELVERMEDRPFALIGVNSDKDRSKLKEDMTKVDITWRSFWCGEKGTQGEIAAAWNVKRWPTIYVFDHQGVIRAKMVFGAELDRIVDELVDQVPPHDASTEETR